MEELTAEEQMQQFSSQRPAGSLFNQPLLLLDPGELCPLLGEQRADKQGKKGPASWTLTAAKA